MASNEVVPEIGDDITTSGMIVSTVTFAFVESDVLEPIGGRLRMALLEAKSLIEPPLRTRESEAVYSKSAELCPV
jgi:hypothetical protein